MERMNTLSDEKNTLKETTHGNLKKIYKMQAKSCRNIFRVYYNQDNFSTELEPREGVMQTITFLYIRGNCGCKGVTQRQVPFKLLDSPRS